MKRIFQSKPKQRKESLKLKTIIEYEFEEHTDMPELTYNVPLIKTNKSSKHINIITHKKICKDTSTKLF